MQLVAGVAGALLLGPVGFGLTSAGVGFAVGSAAYGVFGPRPRGPGPGDLTAPGLQLGSPLARVYGRVRIAVSPIGMPDEFRAIEHESGGGKGTPSGPSTYTYETDLLGAVCDGTNVIAVTREWWNKKLIFSALAESSSETLANSATTDYYASVTDFFGGASQTPAPLYETRVGAGNAPAHRGMFTREYASVQAGTSKTLPQMEVEVITKGTQGDGDVRLLLLGDGANGSTTFVDSSDYGNTVTQDGAAQNSTTGPWSGSGSMYSPDVDSAVTVASIASLGFGTGDFTLEVAVAPDAQTARFPTVFSFGGSTDVHLEVQVDNEDYPDNYVFYKYTGVTINEVIAVAATGGYSVCEFDRRDGVTRCFVNGALVGQFADSANYGTSGTVNVFNVYNLATGINGFVGRAEVRITARSRNAGAHVAPTSFTNDGAGPWTPLPEYLDDVILAELGQDPEFSAADVDVTDVASIEVQGFIAVGDPATNIVELCDMLYVDIVPGNPIKFLRKGRSVVGSIPYADTGAGVGEPGERFGGLEQGGDDEIPGVKAVVYPDINRDHNTGFQRGDRRTSDGPDVKRIVTRLVMASEQARGRAITAALIERLRKDTVKFGIGDKYAGAEPGDAYTVADLEGNQYRLLIERLRYAEGLKSIDWQRDDPNALIASGAADVSDTPSIEVAASGVAAWQAMDLPLLRDADDGPGYYLAAKTSDDSRGFALESANDTTYTEIVTFTRDAVFGVVSAVAGSPAAGPLIQEAWTITVDVDDGTLSSITRAALLADRTANGFAIVSAAGVCKVIGQWRTATLVSAGVYTLSGLLLDRWEDARYVSTIVAGDVFCRLSTAGGIAKVPRSLAQLGLGHYVKVRAERRAAASIAGVAFTAAGVSLKPLSPVHLRAARDHSSGDITISATRRTRSECRFGGDLGDACPLGEASEQYRWRLYTDGTYATLLRDLGTTTSASVTYTAAQISADANVITDTLYVDVRQVSASVGEGYALQDAA